MKENILINLEKSLLQLLREESLKKQIHSKNYFGKRGDVVWDNEFVKIAYLGIYETGDYWGVKFFIEYKSNPVVELKIVSFEMDEYIIDLYPTLRKEFEGKNIEYILMSFDSLNEIGFNSIENMGNIKISFICEQYLKVVAKSPIITLGIVDYLKDYLNEIYTKMNILMNEIEAGIEWSEIDKNYPLEVSFDFIYPNGKHGDIDFELISQYGTFEQISSLIFRAKLLVKKLYIIELTVLFYYLPGYPNNPCINHKANEEVFNILKNHNNIIKLQELYKIAKSNMNYKDERKNVTMQRAYKVIHEKYYQLKKQRDVIYEELISTGKASGKWKSEQQLYVVVKKKYKDAIYQYHAEWLGQQSLDIYIPSLKIGIEYQGIQHYRPVDFFGGDDNFQQQKERDLRKKILCNEKGVKLFEWKYDIEPSLSNLKKLLKDSECY